MNTQEECNCFKAFFVKSKVNESFRLLKVPSILRYIPYEDSDNQIYSKNAGSMTMRPTLTNLAI